MMTLEHYIGLSLLLFCIGVLGVLVRRNTLISIAGDIFR